MAYCGDADCVIVATKSVQKSVSVSQFQVHAEFGFKDYNATALVPKPWKIGSH